MSEQNSVVAIYGAHTGAEEAVKELQRAGIDMHSLSIIGRDYHTDENVVGYYNTGDRMKYWGKVGAFWGGFWGLLFGSAFFAIPGLGAVLVAGPLVAWIVGALEGAVVVGGLSAVGAGLFSLGIPKDSVVKYETALKTDKFLLVVHGSAVEVEKARQVLEGTHPENVTFHSVEAVGASTSSEIRIHAENTMLRDASELQGLIIRATDGELGTAQEFYFDDESWAIRYVVVETGGWLNGRKC